MCHPSEQSCCESISTDLCSLWLPAACMGSGWHGRQTWCIEEERREDSTPTNGKTGRNNHISTDPTGMSLDTAFPLNIYKGSCRATISWYKWFALRDVSHSMAGVGLDDPFQLWIFCGIHKAEVHVSDLEELREPPESRWGWVNSTGQLVANMDHIWKQTASFFLCIFLLCHSHTLPESLGHD